MRKSILTIEDSKALSFVFATVFKNDFDVYSAKNYAEGFYYLRSEKIVDLVIVSIPDEESENFTFLAHLSSSSLFCDIPVVVIADSNDKRLSIKSKALGASLFLSTPFDPIRLSEKVKALIGEKKGILELKKAQ